jgi:hypothetical protein
MMENIELNSKQIRILKRLSPAERIRVYKCIEIEHQNYIFEKNKRRFNYSSEFIELSIKHSNFSCK